MLPSNWCRFSAHNEVNGEHSRTQGGEGAKWGGGWEGRDGYDPSGDAGPSPKVRHLRPSALCARALQRTDWFPDHPVAEGPAPLGFRNKKLIENKIKKIK